MTLVSFGAVTALLGALPGGAPDRSEADAGLYDDHGARPVGDADRLRRHLCDRGRSASICWPMRCYKGALFMVAGAIDHETGTRDVTQLGGLLRADAGLGGGDRAGGAVDGRPAAVPGLHRQGVHVFQHGRRSASERWRCWAGWRPFAMVGANALMIVTAGLVVREAVPGAPDRGCRTHAHEAPVSLWLGPVVLAAHRPGAGRLQRRAGALVRGARRRVARGRSGGRPCLSLGRLHGAAGPERRHGGPGRLDVSGLAAGQGVAGRRRAARWATIRIAAGTRS